MVDSSKVLISFFSGCLLLVGCSNNEYSNSKDMYEVTELFTKDNCTVFRFYNEGNYHYYTNCAGETITSKTRCAKTCVTISSNNKTTVKNYHD